MPRAKGEAVDVVTTPMFDRNATNRQCSTGGLAPDDEYGVDGVRQGNAKGVQGLADFCMAEQRVQPGGVESTAASCGRRVIRTICKEDGRSLGPQRLEFLSRWTGGRAQRSWRRPSRPALVPVSASPYTVSEGFV